MNHIFSFCNYFSSIYKYLDKKISRSSFQESNMSYKASRKRCNPLLTLSTSITFKVQFSTLLSSYLKFFYSSDYILIQLSSNPTSISNITFVAKKKKKWINFINEKEIYTCINEKQNDSYLSSVKFIWRNITWKIHCVYLIQWHEQKINYL